MNIIPRFKKLVLLALAVTFTMASTIKAHAGENGCVNNPDKNVGACAKNVEGTFTCIVSTSKDCVSSD